MAKLISTVLALLCLAVSSYAGALQPRIEIDSAQLHCDNWWPGLYYGYPWQNTTGGSILIHTVELQVVSAQVTNAEFALWFELANDGGGNPPTGPIIASWGNDIYAIGSSPLLYQRDFGANYISVPAGGWVTLKVNCDPTLNAYGGLNSTNFYYVGLVRFWYEQAP